MGDTLTALDATFLELEQRDEGALMSIGGAMVFDPPPGQTAPRLERLQARLAHRLAGLPRYSERLSSPRVGGLSWPRWVEDPDFDVDNHITRAAVSAPGGDAELCDWTAEFFSHPLDRMRPLWQIVLLEGLEDGRWALVQKTHHCLVDGVGSVDVLQLMLDREPRARATHTPHSVPAPASHAWSSLTEHAPGAVVQATAAGAHAAQAGLNAAAHPRDAWTRSRGLAELLVRDEIIGAPHTSLNVPIAQGRSFAVVRTSLVELREIAHQLRGSVNDAVLAACASGLRELLLERGEEPPARGLRAMVPVNLREASERLALGNRVSSLFVELPVAEASALVRFRLIASETRRLKSSELAVGADTFIELAALAPPVLHATLARSAYATRLFNLTITNVPGPQQPMFALGARLREVLPFVPLAAAHSVGIAVFSYDGVLTFGVSADRAATPDLNVLIGGIEQGLDELRDLRAVRTRKPTRNLSSPETRI
jgi:diacylglycerol O-acyltransferase / wax synthase